MRIFFSCILFFTMTQFTNSALSQDYALIENSLTYYLTVKGEKPEKFNVYDRMKEHEVPGVSIAIVNHGKLAWAKSWGFKNASKKNLVTNETLFQAASLSKPLSAIAALRLVEEGLLSLDAPINNYLKRWKISENELTIETPVTLRMLLTHTGGLTVTGFSGYKQTDKIPTTVHLLNGETPANTEAIFVDIKPNTEWRYSGGGYTVAQLAMEDVTGLKYPEIMKKYVLEPFKMNHSSHEIIHSEKIQNQLAFAHDANGKLLEGKYNLYPEMAAASLWTTPTDLAKVVIHTNNIYHQIDEPLLNANSAKELLQIHKGDWGIGYDVTDHENGIKSFSHTGSNEGYKLIFLD